MKVTMFKKLFLLHSNAPGRNDLYAAASSRFQLNILLLVATTTSWHISIELEFNCCIQFFVRSVTEILTGIFHLLFITAVL